MRMHATNNVSCSSYPDILPQAHCVQTQRGGYCTVPLLYVKAKRRLNQQHGRRSNLHLGELPNWDVTFSHHLFYRFRNLALSSPTTTNLTTTQQNNLPQTGTICPHSTAPKECGPPQLSIDNPRSASLTSPNNARGIIMSGRFLVATLPRRHGGEC